ncbi:hypothetical protein M378DRAFT_180424 [Amanita muscaria Koide BX008]|uniref:Uncharacterized protein n=1 Tax=Amanita muscaria (strain Koide BX008) TaxID=946122 RepID=A0A0C2WUK3_AMAMK|nr:hypothetical protein M378DRAFT_180424 [Amanita muscaria Koide BX008]
MFSAGRRPLKPTEKGGKELLTSLTSKRSRGDSLVSIISGSASSTQRPAAKKARSTTTGASMTESVPTSGRSSPDIVEAPSAVPESDPPSTMSATVETVGGEDSGPEDSDSDPEIVEEDVEEDPEAEMSKIRFC